ncbi:hypothetical protein AB0368_05815 [Actinoplanes sp. NPDC051475]|uniref:hypothetical protein n=1 Tax=Actinoplanes sp. NPDC051475 TaxID=3157225 RepID=UPI003450B925
MSLFRTAAATSLVLGFLTACSSTEAADPGISVPPSPSVSPSAAAPTPPADATSSATPIPPNSVGTGAPPGAKKPSGIPKTPTDSIASPGWIDGLVTRGGTGPCYGFADWDGKPYAVYSPVGTELKKGDHIRVRFVPNKLRIDCGEGTQVVMEAFERVQ